MKGKKVEMTSRLKKLLEKILVAEKSERYLSAELSKIREIKKKLVDKIRKEKKAISLVNQAKRLR